MSKGKKGRKKRDLESAVSAWLDGRYACLLLPPPVFKDSTFGAWARQAIEGLKPLLQDLQKNYGVPPERILNILATYKRLRPDSPDDKKKTRRDREMKARDSRALIRAAKF